MVSLGLLFTGMITPTSVKGLGLELESPLELA